ncbi:SGNH/GDSL hydrolase family protein [Shewanella maritima]|uniref:SGNH/GDSL hydrolase family protein n=1 Tax=Shewanella maritima TaxID=2520507 RepID=A0A411PKE3_9GAMM|nr:SGNH/GDSL hydrolase family protein [Shewanella maritima]QBF83988.1 SGNH/GDSL hydrolase family protein [Shewanella maritima]
MDSGKLAELTTLLLVPVYLLQGKWVRFKTNKLPEPDGVRHGLVGSGKPLSVMIIGDSAGAGVGVAEQQDALSGQLSQALSQHHQVQWQLHAQDGDTSTQLVARLEQVEEFKADYVVISIGVNDVTKRTSSQQWLANLEAIISLLQTKFSAKHILFTAIPPIHQFPALPNPLRWWLGQRAFKLNHLLERNCKLHSKVHFESIPFPFEAKLMAADGFHPGKEAYHLWGKYMAQRISQLAQDELIQDGNSQDSIETGELNQPHLEVS